MEEGERVKDKKSVSLCAEKGWVREGAVHAGGVTNMRRTTAIIAADISPRLPHLALLESHGANPTPGQVLDGSQSGRRHLLW